MPGAISTPESFSGRLVRLISEPDFVRFEQLLREPNIFRIVGRSHFERWHSCFWGWLLDPDGSHLLGQYPLVRLLMLLLDRRAVVPQRARANRLLALLPTVSFSDVKVAPNEWVPKERSVKGLGRFDVFLQGGFADRLGNGGRVNVVIEFKIASKPDQRQSRRYADWLLRAHPKDENFLIHVTPSLGRSAVESAGDARWFCLDYQLLNDGLLSAAIQHPNLNPKVQPFILQYMKNLNSRQNGVKLAFTEEERRLALALYEKYADVFDAIYDTLVAAELLEPTPSRARLARGWTRGRIAVRIGGRLFQGGMVAELFERVLRHLVDKGILKKLPLPWGTSVQRFIITNEKPAVHPSGRRFFYPVEYRGYTLETHYDRRRALQVLKELCDALDLSFEAVET